MAKAALPARSPPRWASASLGLAVAALASTLGAPSARAQALSLTARSIYHAYEIQLRPDLGSAAQRDVNRFYQTLEGSGFGLAGGHLDGMFSLRYLTDLGTGFNRDTPLGAGVPAITGASTADILFAYADWRDIIQGRLDLRFGRQLLLDDLDWSVIDGAKLTAHLYRDGLDGVDVELYAGLPVLFEVLFSSEPLLNDGVQVQDGEHPLPGLVLGGAGSLRLLGDLSASVAYRQEVQFRGDDPVALRRGPDGAAAALASAGKTGLQESRLGASLAYDLKPVATSFYGHFVWDLLLGNLEQARSGVAFDPGPGLHFGAEYLRVRPRFAGDSIFNFFNIFPYDRGRVEMTWELLPGLVLQGGYLVQVFRGGPKGPKSASDPGAEGAEYRGSDATHGPSLGLDYRAARWGLSAYAEGATNANGAYAFGGNHRFGYLSGDVAFLDRRLVADARLAFTTVQSDWFEGVDRGLVAPATTSYNASLGARWQLAEAVGTRLLLVKNFGSPLEGGYRVFSELTLRY